MRTTGTYCFFGSQGATAPEPQSPTPVAKMAAAAKHAHETYDDEEDLDFDEEYFSRTYQPLSNLPTPPLSCRNSIASLSPRGLAEQDELLESPLLGPAIHLVNLIPPKASLVTPSVPLVHQILTRANLPAETVALAVCILDSLNAKFSQNWRLSCPLAPASSQLHIDSVRPEVIVLTSLVVATKFLEDYQDPTQHYATRWGEGLWTCDQINVTERCVMESLDYRIMPLWDRVLIDDALADMERAGRQAMADRRRFDSVPSTKSAPMSSRKTVTSFADVLTPAETPKFENVAWLEDDDGCVGGGADQNRGPTAAPGGGLDPRASAPRNSGFPFPSASTATPPTAKI